LKRFYFNSRGFEGDAKDNHPYSSKHTPYLEAIICAVYKAEGLEYCKEWVMKYIYPELKKLSNENDESI